jgi:hypothetical protein
MRLHLANSLPQDSFLKLTGESKGGFKCVSKQQFLRTQVNVNIFNFDNLLREVLNGSFNMSLPATFNNIVKANPADNPKQASSRVKGEGNGRDKKKRESKNRNGILAKNMSQDNNFKVATGKMWKNTFSKQLPQIAQSGRI